MMITQNWLVKQNQIHVVWTEFFEHLTCSGGW